MLISFLTGCWTRTYIDFGCWLATACPRFRQASASFIQKFPLLQELSCLRDWKCVSWIALGQSRVFVSFSDHRLFPCKFSAAPQLHFFAFLRSARHSLSFLCIMII